MTREEVISLIRSAQLMLVNPTTNEPVSDLYEALDMAIKALEQEPNIDMESEEIKNLQKRAYLEGFHEASKMLVKQESKTGHWILKRTFPTKLYDEYLNEYKCSECYREIRCTESQLVNYPYCHCGAKMIDEQKSEV